MKQGFRTSIFIISAALAITGCSHQNDAPQIPDSLQSLNASEPQDEHLSELENWLFPPAEAEKARQAFVTRCVKETNGGTYQEAEVPHNLGIVPPGGVTTAELKKNGYQPTSKTNSSYAPPVNEGNGLAAYAGQMENGSTSVSFLGYDSGKVPLDGCQAQSYQYIYGSVENGLKAAVLAPSFVNAIGEEVRADEAYTTLQKDWSTCMAEKKFENFDDVTDASDTALRSSSADAKKIADADIACRDKVEYDKKFSDIQNKYYETVYQRVAKFGDELNAIHETGKQNAEKDKAKPKNTAPVPTNTESAQPTSSATS